MGMKKTQHQKSKIQNVGVALGIAVAVLVVATFARPPEDKVVFLDVGQGDSIFIQSGIRQVLIDGGSGGAVLKELAREMPTFDKTIEVLVATHPDKDHIEGLLHVLDHYDVSLVLLPYRSASSQLQEAWLEKLQATVGSGRTQVRFATTGQRLTTGDIVMRILGPTQLALASSKTNNASVITRIDMHDTSFLLTGDAEAVVEQQLVRALPTELLDVDILKAGHHGSKTSSTPAFLGATSPAAAVLSVGAGNSYGHPHPLVLARLQGTHIFRTDESGAIRFLYDGAAWRYTCVLC